MEAQKRAEHVAELDWKQCALIAFLDKDDLKRNWIRWKNNFAAQNYLIMSLKILVAFKRVKKWTKRWNRDVESWSKIEKRKKKLYGEREERERVKHRRIGFIIAPRVVEL